RGSLTANAPEEVDLEVVGKIAAMPAASSSPVDMRSVIGREQHDVRRRPRTPCDICETRERRDVVTQRSEGLRAHWCVTRGLHHPAPARTRRRRRAGGLWDQALREIQKTAFASLGAIHRAAAQ